ncbi:2Fe-2S iron-sulfur cluster-binding protein [Comamonas terrigena]|jgi:CDP-4-dehydro-6-deoxyglucose reductase|uniref:2Fe-2S iron-sulfur cluster-binding protein n=1 Tax=Comamonas terrigena TaxID=32013 RepID=UPI00244A51C3|nr:2Fe-2S iron-sulfur cluster-binding protein [Comamonas terrigena]MDH0049307.1 FAD-binding oxidoreductase [Comamonas terrigena]MDH0510971.1 FAD-binding oxidoreductase [Comamonas terrigena]MDH1090573.1 FAD-binding oxidoreductase [Comamonas terrigena]
MFTVELINGKNFQAEVNEPLLDAAARAGIRLNYSCKTGRCSSCKCRVISGKADTLQDAMGLDAQEKSEGWILSCISAATTNMVLEAEDLGDVCVPDAKTLPCRISQIDLLAPDVVRVFLRFPPTADFQFLAGQYVDVIGPGGIRRSYSLANADFLNRQLELHIRKVDGGAMSNYWFSQAKPNDLLRIHGPLGTFFLRDVQGTDLIFLATGTGIAPIKSMLASIDSMPASNRPRSIHIFWGGRTPDDFYIKPESAVGIQNWNFVLSREHPDWQGIRGYVQDAVLNSTIQLKQAMVYACGSDAMIQSAKRSLTNAGLPSKSFYSDAFVSSNNIN